MALLAAACSSEPVRPGLYPSAVAEPLGLLPPSLGAVEEAMERHLETAAGPEVGALQVERHRLPKAARNSQVLEHYMVAMGPDWWRDRAFNASIEQSYWAFGLRQGRQVLAIAGALPRAFPDAAELPFIVVTNLPPTPGAEP